MNNEITDKTHVLITSGMGRIYITAKEAAHIRQAIEDGTKTIFLGDQMITTSAIRGIITGDQLVEADRTRGGEFKCKFGQYHARGIQCNCAEGRRLGLL